MKAELCGIKQIIKGQYVIDGAGVKINRIIGSYHLGDIDPFVLLDEIRSENPKDYIAGFPTHPHRGIETITYMIHGSFRHKDSRGGGGLLTDGCVQWMTAGKGILHSEMPEATEGEACGYQLWVSLPADKKMVDARYQHLSPDMIPVVKKDGLLVRIISGEYGGKTGPADNWVKTHYFDVEMGKDKTFTFDISRDMNSFCYIRKGSVNICGDEIPERRLVEFTSGTGVEIKGLSDHSALLFLAGRPNNEPIVRGGPFVMNTEEEIDQAFADYRNGTLW